MLHLNDLGVEESGRRELEEVKGANRRARMDEEHGTAMLRLNYYYSIFPEFVK